MLFADVRGYTALSESLPAAEIRELMNRSYALAADVLIGHDAVVDKLIGDEVMALFIPLWNVNATSHMLQAAEDLLRGVGFGSDEEPWLALGIGLDYGLASVGNVGSGEVKDFTAIGDVVNTAARLQACAEAGKLVMSERVRANLRGHLRTRRPSSFSSRERRSRSGHGWSVLTRRLADQPPGAEPRNTAPLLDPVTRLIRPFDAVGSNSRDCDPSSFPGVSPSARLSSLLRRRRT